ncbi:hypothetical protein Acr_15g0011600 [Actinidia rufa]|uniref:Uncharacterized protein n=1 Tax=Actinidia rufa TaxID=165716 RepID=A0A7J0FV34_9ERIC|nr:hypothetical protein Acr_15g0011600 [Actinidia rufa]
MNTIKKGRKNLGLSDKEREEDRGDEDTQIEGVQGDLNVQGQEQDLGNEEEHDHEGVHEEVHAAKEPPTHGAFPTQEGTSTQGGLPAWFLEYFGELNSLGRIEQRQNEIIQTQAKHGEYIDRLGDFYENLNAQQQAFHQQYSTQINEVETQLEGLWVHLIPPPPFDPANAPPRPPYYHDPPY